MKLIDAHCHLANLADTHDVPALMDEAQKYGIEGFVSSALRRSEISWHLAHPDSRIKWHAGIHPNFDECDLTLDDIESALSNKVMCAVGEIGMDRQNFDLVAQKTILHSQLALAQDHQVPAVLHIVGLQTESYMILKQFRLPYLVHGYAGSLDGFKLLASLDSVFTISSRILREDKAQLLQAIVKHGRYLFETDMTQYYVKEGETNPLLRLLKVFSESARLTGISADELQAIQNESYSYMFGAL